MKYYSINKIQEQKRCIINNFIDFLERLEIINTTVGNYTYFHLHVVLVE